MSSHKHVFFSPPRKNVHQPTKHLLILGQIFETTNLKILLTYSKLYTQNNSNAIAMMHPIIGGMGSQHQPRTSWVAARHGLLSRKGWTSLVATGLFVHWVIPLALHHLLDDEDRTNCQQVIKYPFNNHWR